MNSETVNCFLKRRSSSSMIDDWKRELELVGELVQQHPNNYLVWDHRRFIVENIGSEAVTNELQFTNNILLSMGTTNIQAWSHREWIIQKFDASLWLPELQYCHQILDKDIFNVVAWNQICRAVRLNPNMKKESRDIEVAYAKKHIYAQPGNEGPWLYLKFLYLKDKKSLYRDPDLECIYVDVLAEEADRIKLAVRLDPPPQCMMNYANMVDRRGCLHALNLIVDLITLGYRASLNTRLVESINVLLHNLDWSYSYVDPKKIESRSKFLRNVGALVLSLDAFRIRYCYMYRGYYFGRFPPIDDANEELEVEEQEEEEEPPCFGRFSPIDDANKELEEEEPPQTPYVDNLPLQQLEELFKSWITSNGFVKLRSKWKKRLFRTYLQNRKRYDRTEKDALEDLKWNARRLLLKKVGSNEAARYELQYTTDIINGDAYNHRAWSHRQWVFHIFGKDWEDRVELEFCGEIIAKNPYNNLAWDHRYFLVTRLVPKIYIGIPAMRFSKAAFEEVTKFRECLQEKRVEEVDFAMKIIASNPENQLPWSHISSLHRVCSSTNDSFCFNVGLRHSILRVLEEARDCACRISDGSIMRLGGGSASVNNARGIINALNMFLEITVDRNCSIMGEKSIIPNLAVGEGKRFKTVLDELCPDSWFDTFQYKDTIRVVKKIGVILRAMEIDLRDCGRLLRHVTDELLTRNGYNAFLGILRH